jgi:hypothetical protein
MRLLQAQFFLRDAQVRPEVGKYLRLRKSLQ